MKELNVLLVEDAHMVIEVVETILFGYKPTLNALPDIKFNLTKVKSFEDAYKQKDKPFDLVLLDDNLPQKESDPRDKYGIYLNAIDCGYQLIPAFKKHSFYVVGTSSESAGKRTDYDKHWEKSGLDSWEELLKILVYVVNEKK